ncbi:MAG: glutaredoxin family protein [Pseudomonadales bacterium]|nr:glutaredoxin family protein [Pseudomonadales bacterium]
MSTQAVYTLFGRRDCELCDRAEALFLEVADLRAVSLNKVDIDHDRELHQRYALAIPVLRRDADNSELFWPFPRSRLRDFLAAGT